ncbi:tetratricopeptide repeat protein [Flagellimonas sp. DF-77]|uniref:tetratricopeptide repeat protein n=1 Tax=Flagellimonas algarum TaxID=3230298 RepID=UPI00339B4B5D
MKFRFIVTLLLFLFIKSVFAQNQEEIDSLLQVYESTTETEKKIKTLFRLYEVTVYDDPEKAKEYLDTCSELSTAAESEYGIIRSAICYGHYYALIGQVDLGAEYDRKALKLSHTYDNDFFITSILRNLATYEEHKGNYKRAISLMDSAATYQLQYKDFLRYGSALNVIGYNYYELGNYPKAMEYFKKAISTMDTLPTQTYHQADTYRNIGNLMLVQKEHDPALEAFEAAMATYIATDDHLYQATTLMDIGNVHKLKKDYDKAIEFHNRCLEIAETHGFPTQVVYAYYELGAAFLEKKEYETAISYYNKCLNQDLTDVSEINQIAFLLDLGHTHTLNNEWTQGLEYLNASVHKADSLKLLKKLKEALAIRSLNYEKQGDLRKSLVDLKRSQKINDSAFTMEKAKQMNKLQVVYETERKEAEIAIQQEEINTLNEKSRADNLQKGLYAGGMGSALALSGLLVFGFRQRMKKNRIAREKQEEIYRQEIAHKKKELASQTLHLVQKNTFLDELKENLENLKNSPDKFKMEFRRIVMLLKKEKASDKDWETFKTYFSEVHNDFDQKLKTLYADISEKEIRLAAFLRMNLTTKEIAATLNVLPDSILKSKYRLKKKLGLDKETDLTSYLNTL